METPAQTARTNRALMVLQHANDGMTIVDACQEVGIPRSTFYDICKRNPERIAEFQKLIEASERLQLMMILDSREAILLKVIRDALSDKTKPRQRVAIYKMLVEQTERLHEKIKEEHGIEAEDIDELLKGPKLIPGKSRFSATEVVGNSYPASGSY